MALPRQTKGNVAGSQDPCSVTLDQTPVEGNLLIAIASERSGGSAANHSLGAGWTHAISVTSDPANSSYRRSFSVFYKVAGSSESATISLDDGTANGKYLSVYEYEHEAGEDSWILTDSSENSNSEIINGTVQGTGSTGAIAGQHFLWAGMIIRRRDDTQDANISWDQDIDNAHAEYNPGTEYNMTHAAGYTAVDIVDGAKQTTATLNNSLANRGLNAAILAFKTSASVNASGSIDTGVDISGEATKDYQEEGILPASPSMTGEGSRNYFHSGNSNVSPSVSGTAEILNVGSGSLNISPGIDGDGIDLSVNIDSVTTITPQPDDAFTINLASGTGPFTVFLEGQSMPIDSQDANSIDLTWQDLRVFGNKRLSFNTSHVLTVQDSQLTTDTINITTLLPDNTELVTLSNPNNTSDSFVYDDSRTIITGDSYTGKWLVGGDGQSFPTSGYMGDLDLPQGTHIAEIYTYHDYNDDTNRTWSLPAQVGITVGQPTDGSLGFSSAISGDSNSGDIVNGSIDIDVSVDGVNIIDAVKQGLLNLGASAEGNRTSIENVSESFDLTKTPQAAASVLAELSETISLNTSVSGVSVRAVEDNGSLAVNVLVSGSDQVFGPGQVMGVLDLITSVAGEVVGSLEAQAELNVSSDVVATAIADFLTNSNFDFTPGSTAQGEINISTFGIMDVSAVMQGSSVTVTIYANSYKKYIVTYVPKSFM